MKILNQLNDWVWGNWMLVLLIGTGIYFMIRLDFCPLKNLKFAIGDMVGQRGKSEKGEVSPLAALMTELAATIGTGNIVGVASAMLLGGPGALVWMFLSGVLGMATKLVESTLAVKYRRKNSKGDYVGGPMYVAEAAFRRKKIGKLVGACFAVFAVGASFGMGNMVQANSIAISFESTFGASKAFVGLCISILTILIVLGGVKRITGITTILVPFMGGLYLAGCLVVILTHLRALPEGMLCIICSAVSPRSVGGGLFGMLTVNQMQAMRWGISRGVFSNEAGLGASGISAASADTKDYIRQGYISMTGVFFDTIVMCLLTGITLAVSGAFVDASNQTDCNLVVLTAFRSTFGSLGEAFVSICIGLFAFATIIAWAYQGEQAFLYLARPDHGIWYRFIYSFLCLLGAVCPLDIVWTLSDLCNGLMVVPNLVCVYLLSGEICREIRAYHFDRI